MSTVASSPLTSQIVSLAQGERLFVVGDEVCVKLSGKDTGGQHALFEIHTPPGAGPPPHIHTREDETFILLEGDYEFLVGSESKRAKGGDIVFGPRNVPHTYKNVGTSPSRMYVLCTPSGFEDFFRRVNKEIGRGEPDVPRLVQIGADAGLSFLL